MTAKMTLFLSELATLLERYGATLGYTNNDDGIHAGIGREDVCVGFLEVGDPGESIRDVLSANASLDRLEMLSEDKLIALQSLLMAERGKNKKPTGAK